MFAPHVYTETMYTGGALTTDALTDEIVTIETSLEAAVMDVPIWIGEWGAFENENAERYQRAFYDLLDRHRLGSAYWHYTQGYTDGLQAQPLAADAGHLRVYPEAFPGSADWTFDPETRTFLMVLTVDDPTPPSASLVVPARLYPEGFTITVSGGTTAEPSTNRVAWTVTGPGTQALKITPA